jgi:microcystin-dependent protein
MGSYFRDYLDRKASQRPTIGDTKFSAVSSDHMGWLKCDGRSLSVADYNLLFQVVGYAFGGSGNNFNLPDSQGRVPGAIGPNGESTRKLGDVSGSETHTLTIAQMPSHNHGTDANDTTVGNGLTGDTSLDVTQTSLVTNVTANNSEFVVAAGNTPPHNSLTTGVTISTVDPSITPNPHHHSIKTQGGDKPHNNIQPTIFMGSLYMYCGKVKVGNYAYTTGTNIL